MKTFLRRNGAKGVAFSAIFLSAIFTSCNQNQNEGISNASASFGNSEASSSSYTDQVSRMSATASSVVSNNELSGTTSRTDSTFFEITERLRDYDDFACAVVTFQRTGTKDAPSGIITVNYGTGCTNNAGVTRAGKMFINYVGKRFVPGSVITTTFDSMYIDNIKLEGVFTHTNIQADASAYPKFECVLTGGKLTFPDGSTITRQHDLVREWQRAANPRNDVWVTYTQSTGSGVTRMGKTWSMVVTKDIIRQASCKFYGQTVPVSGTRALVVNGENGTIDYGDGSCDNEATLTINNKTKIIQINHKESDNDKD